MIYAYLGAKNDLFTACVRREALPIAHALAGAAEALSDWGLDPPEETTDALITRLIDIFWTGLKHSGGESA